MVKTGINKMNDEIQALTETIERGIDKSRIIPLSGSLILLIGVWALFTTPYPTLAISLMILGNQYAAFDAIQRQLKKLSEGK